MEKNTLIKARTALKAGKNLPLRIIINNLHRIVNEANIFQFTKWDDDNEILYVYSLPDPVNLKSPSNKDGAICLLAEPYEYIEALELASFPLSELENSLNSLIAAGASISDETKERVIKLFNAIYDPRNVNLGPTEINRIIGTVDGRLAVNDNDDYYEGKFKQSFAETRSTAANNAYVDSLKDNENN